MNKRRKSALSSKKQKHIMQQSAKQHAAKQSAQLKNISTSSANRWVKQQAAVDANWRVCWDLLPSLGGCGMWGGV